jgi:hypothetical protein
MRARELVYGLLDTTAAIQDRTLASKCRELTLAWSRYNYHGPIIEHYSIDEIVDRAAEGQYRYCFIQAYGQIIHERWTPGTEDSGDFLATLKDCLFALEGMVAGHILGSDGGWYGLDHHCLLVDLQRYAECGRPTFGRAGQGSATLPAACESSRDGRITRLDPADSVAPANRNLPGWNYVSASLRHGLPIVTLPERLQSQIVNLEPEFSGAGCPRQLLKNGVDAVSPDRQMPELNEGQRDFLQTVRSQTANAQRGVFLLNVESYADVETPQPGFAGPVSTLYCVASGFKPNRILQTHGMAADSRIVFFDYSPNALAVRKVMVEEWDGEDFPQFMRHLFARYPAPATFYQLWAGVTPENIDWSAVDKLWQDQLGQLGGALAFRDHWREYRQLPHEYIHCDVLTDPHPLLERILPGPGALMWFSNAPFTMYANWFHSFDARRRMYRRWMERLAELNPEMLLYGSDYANSNVNCIAAGEYWQRFRNEDQGPLNPCNLYQQEVRM